MEYLYNTACLCLSNHVHSNAVIILDRQWLHDCEIFTRTLLNMLSKRNVIVTGHRQVVIS